MVKVRNWLPVRRAAALFGAGLVLHHLAGQLHGAGQVCLAVLSYVCASTGVVVAGRFLKRLVPEREQCKTAAAKQHLSDRSE